MKKTILCAALCGTLLLSGCGTTGNSSHNILGNIAGAVLGGGNSTQTDKTTSTQTQTSTSGSSNIFGNILSSVLGSGRLSQEDLYGNWKYNSSDCVFETENLLLKAGGAAAASKIESELNGYMTTAGFNANTCQFTFNKDNTYTAKIGGRTISGNYTFDEKNKTVKMTALGGLLSLTPHVAKSGSNISLLFEGDKLLTLASTVGAISGNDKLKLVSKLLKKYDGLQVGLQMNK